MVPHIRTKDGVTLVLGSRPYTLSADHALFAEVMDAVNSGRTAADVLEILERPARKLQEATGLTPDMYYQGGVVKFRGEVLHNYAADVLVSLVASGQDATPLANFLAKLQSNPSKRVVDNLYAFLEHGKVPITVDGDFLAYKAVRKDFKDIHSGTFDNSIGAVCEMARNRVDEDPNRTCSAGLHVCSFDYLPHFASTDGHVMVCKINPADVVAIPADYNNTKMRVSRYVVIDEVKDYYGKPVDVLARETSIRGAVRGKFEVRTIYDGHTSSEYVFTMAEAKAQAESIWHTDEPAESVAIIDDEGMVLFAFDGEWN